MGDKDFSVIEQLNIFSIGVGENLEKSRTELVDIPGADCRFKELNASTRMTVSVSGASKTCRIA